MAMAKRRNTPAAAPARVCVKVRMSMSGAFAVHE